MNFIKQNKKIFWILSIGAFSIFVAIVSAAGVGYWHDYQSQKATEAEVQHSKEAALQKQIQAQQQALDQFQEQSTQMSQQLSNTKSQLQNLANQPPKIVIQNNAPDISSVVSGWRPQMASIGCSWYGSDGKLVFESYGSGLLTKTTNGLYEIITNKHVISPSTFLPYACAATFPGTTEQYGFRVIPVDDNTYADNTWNLTVDPYNDLATIILRAPKQYALSVAKPLTWCKAAQVHVGDQVVIIGYPSIGSPTDITATDGIISGYDNGYYITSAKIEHGNSGGVAIMIKNNCYLGIPSYVDPGQLESLGRILDFNAYMSSLAQ